MNRLVVLLVGLLGASCAGESPRPAPVASVSGCGLLSARPSVILGFGSGSFISLEEGSETPQVFGPQGGSHVVVGARVSGFDPRVDVTFEARDAYSGAQVATGRVVGVEPAHYADEPDQSCDVRDVLLVFGDRFPGGAGLADVSVTARDASGHMAMTSLRLWLGHRLAACVPMEGAPTRLVPLVLVSATQGREEAVEIVMDAILRPTSGADVLVAAGVLNFAASAVTLVGRLFEDTPGGRVLVREVRASPPLDVAHAVPTQRRAAAECVAPVTLRLPVDSMTTGRPLVLALTAEDGLGHTLTTERLVSLLER